ncbi:uncharacterized protein LOC143430285 [Xylocopa sonorina]|uniref:uncharacterized protein LOC143430285 n=1 Tax=Xylocopa sonorina TaxID=1818115 RepID=UPI00403A8434
MALKQRVLSTIVITISIGVSPVFTWNPDIHRYESYDLQKGPVFYEAYYPDTNEESRTDYQEKRYLEREPVLEKTYQVPSERLPYPETNIPVDNYRGSDPFLRNEDRFSLETNARPFDIKELSKLARRAISRDLENWNTLENYLDRAKHQEPLYRRIVVPEPGYRIAEQPVRRIEPNLPVPLKQQRDLGRELYEEIREEPAALSRRLQSPIDERDSIGRLTTRDLVGRGTSGSFGTIRYENQPPREQEMMETVRSSLINVPSLRDTSLLDTRSALDPYPTENIFAPRPQVINYIFSKKPEATAENMARSVSEARGESVSKSYGDNLIRDEAKKSESKEVKVTSIEVSEIPKHKTRHHHGEWPKRDYSYRHQS